MASANIIRAFNTQTIQTAAINGPGAGEKATLAMVSRSFVLLDYEGSNQEAQLERVLRRSLNDCQ